MSVRRVMGIETEYGIFGTGAESNPVAASSLLVNAYASEVDRLGGGDRAKAAAYRARRATSRTPR